MVQDYNKDYYQEGVQNVVKSVILYSTTFRSIAVDLVDLYSGDTIQPYDYATLFKNFYERTDQLIDAVSSTMADLIRRSTLMDNVRSRTTNSLRKEIMEDSFQEMNENLQRFRAYMTELGIMVEAKTQENEFLVTTLTDGVVASLLSGNRKVSFVDGVSLSGMVNQTTNNNQQINQLQADKVNMALAAMITTTSLLQNLVTRLMDQYCSLVYGGSIDLNTRDFHLNESNKEINAVAEICNKIAYCARDVHTEVKNYITNYKNPTLDGDRKNAKVYFVIGGSVLVLGLFNLDSDTLAVFLLLIAALCLANGKKHYDKSKLADSDTSNPTETIEQKVNELRGYSDQLKNLTNQHLGMK